MSAVNQLSYVVGETTDLRGWRRYGTEVLGHEVVADGDDRLLYLRSDERHHRLAVRAGHTDDVAYVGWEVADRAALDAAAAALERHGVTVVAGKPEEAADRRVLDFVHFVCPHSGVRMELVVGHESLHGPRFRPTRDLAGFRTGELGMGHVVLYAPDVKAAADFYVKALGFGVTDFASIPGAGLFAAFLHCNPRHHSLAFMHIPGAPRRIQHVMFETVTMDDVGYSHDVCLDRRITSTAPGRHHNDRTFSFYFRNPSGWHFEYGWAPRTIDPETWDTEHYLLQPGFAWGHQGLMEMV
ncbi:VOC family protein [Actinomadura chibensis]|uniref:Glyoxalase n=1 Tax=Actinomadura chibensis TaxID=392828 RepID=A0A5D0N9S6_9ACTN|nr:VOC family protein [Actinomadura chibensis]TYB41066.1 glyoxalase [Actinomadura chibensis]